MRTVTATEASRSFAALLDAAEAGETIRVTRAGRQVATISPPTLGSTAGLIAFLDAWPASDDDAFETDVLMARELLTGYEGSWDDD